MPIRKAIIKRAPNKKNISRKARFVDPGSLTPKEIKKEIKRLNRKMNDLAVALEFEQAVVFRDQIKKLKNWLKTN